MSSQQKSHHTHIRCWILRLVDTRQHETEQIPPAWTEGVLLPQIENERVERWLGLTVTFGMRSFARDWKRLHREWVCVPYNNGNNGNRYHRDRRLLMRMRPNFHCVGETERRLIDDIWVGIGGLYRGYTWQVTAKPTRSRGNPNYGVRLLVQIHCLIDIGI